MTLRCSQSRSLRAASRLFPSFSAAPAGFPTLPRWGGLLCRRLADSREAHGGAEDARCHDALGPDALGPDALGPDALGPDALGHDAPASDEQAQGDGGPPGPRAGACRMQRGAVARFVVMHYLYVMFTPRCLRPRKVA
jgi:hypothetical protein